MKPPHTESHFPNQIKKHEKSINSNIKRKSSITTMYGNSSKLDKNPLSASRPKSTVGTIKTGAHARFGSHTTSIVPNQGSSFINNDSPSRPISNGLAIASPASNTTMSPPMTNLNDFGLLHSASPKTIYAWTPAYSPDLFMDFVDFNTNAEQAHSNAAGNLATHRDPFDSEFNLALQSQNNPVQSEKTIRSQCKLIQESVATGESQTLWDQFIGTFDSINRDTVTARVQYMQANQDKMKNTTKITKKSSSDVRPKKAARIAPLSYSHETSTVQTPQEVPSGLSMLQDIDLLKISKISPPIDHSEANSMLMPSPYTMLQDVKTVQLSVASPSAYFADVNVTNIQKAHPSSPYNNSSFNKPSPFNSKSGTATQASPSPYTTPQDIKSPKYTQTSQSPSPSPKYNAFSKHSKYHASSSSLCSSVATSCSSTSDIQRPKSVIRNRPIWHRGHVSFIARYSAAEEMTAGSSTLSNTQSPNTANEQSHNQSHDAHSSLQKTTSTVNLTLPAEKRPRKEINDLKVKRQRNQTWSPIQSIQSTCQRPERTTNTLITGSQSPVSPISRNHASEKTNWKNNVSIAVQDSKPLKNLPRMDIYARMQRRHDNDKLLSSAAGPKRTQLRYASTPCNLPSQDTIGNHQPKRNSGSSMPKIPSILPISSTADIHETLMRVAEFVQNKNGASGSYSSNEESIANTNQFPMFSMNGKQSVAAFGKQGSTQTSKRPAIAPKPSSFPIPFPQAEKGKIPFFPWSRPHFPQ
jgi:phage gp37-like protein